MKWKAKERDLFAYQSERDVWRFALFPTKLSNSTWIWLESYRSIQERRRKVIKNTGSNIPLTLAGWLLFDNDKSDYVEISWITTRRYQRKK